MLCVVALVQTDPASAFSKFEHEQLTYYAFAAALHDHCRLSLDTALCGALALITRAHSASPSVEVAETPLSAAELGGITRAVDYFSHLKRLAPDLDDCFGKEENGCRDKVIKECRKQASEACRDNAGQEAACGIRERTVCTKAAVDDTRTRVDNRRSRRLLRALALHRNEEHFRADAQEMYQLMHGRALEAVRAARAERMHRDETARLALLAEAVALHFLQDAFAPGHLASPRAEYADSLAGALHDKFNRRGLDIGVGDGLCDLTAGLVRALRGGNIPFLEEFKRRNRIEPEDLLQDIERFESEVCALDGSYTSYGDKHLLMGLMKDRGEDPHRSRSLHRVALLLATRASIEELFANSTTIEPLQLCYQPPSKPEAPDTGPFVRLGKDDPDFWPPALALGRTASPPCWHGADPGFLLAYKTCPCDLAVSDPLREETPLVGAFQIAFSSRGDQRRRIEFAVDIAATQGFVQREDNGDFPEDWHLGNGLGTVSFSAHWESLREMDAYGAGLLYGRGFKFSIFDDDHRDFDGYVGLEPGLGYYKHRLDSTTKFRWSARLGIGLSFFAVEALYEDGYEYGATGFESDERWSMNFRFRFSHTWFYGSPK